MMMIPNTDNVEVAKIAAALAIAERHMLKSASLDSNIERFVQAYEALSAAVDKGANEIGVSDEQDNTA